MGKKVDSQDLLTLSPFLGKSSAAATPSSLPRRSNRRLLRLGVPPLALCYHRVLEPVPLLQVSPESGPRFLYRVIPLVAETLVVSGARRVGRCSTVGVVVVDEFPLETSKTQQDSRGAGTASNAAIGLSRDHLHPLAPCRCKGFRGRARERDIDYIYIYL